MASVILASIVTIFYYIAVLAIGVWGGRRIRGDQVETHLPTAGAQQRPPQTKTPEDYLVRLFVASRNVPLLLVTASMTATWVGGGYLNGTAEVVFSQGLLWAQATLGHALSLVFGGMLFAGRMRVTKALTMLDPFQQHYGPWVAIPLLVPAVCGELFRTAATLSVLGDAVAVIIHFNPKLIIVASACVTVVYTSLGSLFSVLYTDAFQLVSIVVGLLVCLPGIMTDDATGKIGDPYSDWMGKIETRNVSQMIDQLLTTTFGGIPWQVYFQRVLSTDTVFSAKLMSYMSAIGCIGLAVPPALIGAVSKSANFTSTGYPGPFNLLERHRRNVLLYAMRYLTSRVISFVGLLAIIAAVLSTVDSSLLSAGTLFARNMHQFLLRPQASDLEMCVTLRIVIFAMAIVATATALVVQAAFNLWMLSSDLVYVLLFPQFVGLFYLRQRCNAYGVIIGFAVGLGSRLLCGEPVVGLPALIKLPLYDVERGQQFPFRTVCMLISMTGLLIGSGLTAFAFRTGLIPSVLDVGGCLPDQQAKAESTPVTSSVTGSQPSTSVTASPAVVTGDASVAPVAEDEPNIDSPRASSPTAESTAVSPEAPPKKKNKVKSSRSAARTGSHTPSKLLKKQASQSSKHRRERQESAKLGLQKKKK